jgi:hypothetical protein
VEHVGSVDPPSVSRIETKDRLVAVMGHLRPRAAVTSDAGSVERSRARAQEPTPGPDGSPHGSPTLIHRWTPLSTAPVDSGGVLEHAWTRVSSCSRILLHVWHEASDRWIPGPRGLPGPMTARRSRRRRRLGRDHDGEETEGRVACPERRHTGDSAPPVLPTSTHRPWHPRGTRRRGAIRAVAAPIPRHSTSSAELHG